LLTIQAGAGGQDSKNFVFELFAAYSKWAKKNRLEVEFVETTDSKLVIEVSGKRAWESFKEEPGKHVVQRVPPTESKGRRHTSIVSVAVMPVLEENNYEPLDRAEVKITTARGTGNGGQHRNVTDSAVRAVHAPTKLEVVIDGRCQHQNRKKAMKILTARVRNQEQENKQKAYDQERKSQMKGGNRSDKMRTYNFIDSFVRNHKTNKEIRNIKKVMKGQFDLII
jgi:peptide chain release factor 1